MELLLVRHAMPARVVREAADGPADPSLSDEGREQAQRLARWLGCEPVDAICVSPLRRARETAEPLAEALDIEPTVLAGLAEFDAAASAYIPIEELVRTRDPRLEAMVEGRWHELGVDLDFDTFARRVVETVEHVVATHPGRRVAVVSHGGIINVYLAHVLGMQKRAFWLDARYTSISRVLAASTGARTVITINESGHLRSTHDALLG